MRPVLIALVLGILPLAPVKASVLYVDRNAPGPNHDGLSWQTAFLTPAQALDAAAGGDEVWVRAGFYAGGFTLKASVGLYGGFAGTETTRDQRDPVKNVTALDFAAGTISVLAGSPPSTVLDGFELTANHGISSQVAIKTTDASPTIRNNTFRRGFLGEPIVCSGGAPVIAGNTFTSGTTSASPINLKNGCAATVTGNLFDASRGAARWTVSLDPVAGASLYASAGGGAVCCDSSPAVIRGNTMRFCYSPVGGAVFTTGLPGPTIVGNTIIECAAEYGGAVYAQASDQRIADNTIVSSFATYTGGALYVSGSAMIVNNTLAGCLSPAGGAVALTSSSSGPAAQITLANNIIAFGTGGVANNPYSPAAVTLRSNCVSGNTAFNYAGLADPTGTYGNIGGDPGLADLPRVNSHIQPFSPCRDAGDDAFVEPGDTDFDGQPRLQGTHVDIGADESDGFAWNVPSYPVVRVSPRGNDANDGSTWVLAKRTIAAAAAVIGADGAGDVWIAAGTYQDPTSAAGTIRFLGGFSGAETSESQRDPAANLTIIQTGSSGSTPLLVSAPAMSATLDGLTIRNSGNAVSAYGTKVTVTNCRITGITVGPALFLNRCMATIQDCVIDNNRADQGGGVQGQGSSVTMRGCTVRNNRSTGDGCGASLGDCHVDLRGNSIQGNNAGANGGGINIYFSRGVVANNVVTQNGASGVGGGICLSGSGLTVKDNLVTGNTGGDGGGVAAYEDGASLIANNTVVANTSAKTAGIAIVTPSFPSSGPSHVLANNIVAFNSGAGITLPDAWVTLKNNDVYGQTVNVAGIPDPTGTNGNISADPLFVEKAGDDYHLLPGSPCVDAGDDSVVAAGDTDRDGRSRSFGPHVDTGAYEYRPAAPTLGDVRRALALAGGLAVWNPADAVLAASGSGTVGLPDAVAVAKKFAGLE